MPSIDPFSADAVVGALALAVASGYVVPSVGTAIATTVDALLVPFVAVGPFSVVLFGLASVAGTYSAVVSHRLRDTDRLDALQERTTDLQDRVGEAREAGDDERLDDLQAERADLTREYIAAMARQVKPMAYSLLVSAPAFLWLRWLLEAGAAATVPAAVSVPLVGQVAWTATVVGPLQVWLAWYLGGTVSASLLARRLARRVGA
jgi:uncharacterized membrane protein (DUF106 family)